MTLEIIGIQRDGLATEEALVTPPAFGRLADTVGGYAVGGLTVRANDVQGITHVHERAGNLRSFKPLQRPLLRGGIAAAQCVLRSRLGTETNLTALRPFLKVTGIMRTGHGK
jgi:hypothetical protein